MWAQNRCFVITKYKKYRYNNYRFFVHLLSYGSVPIRRNPIRRNANPNPNPYP